MTNPVRLNIGCGNYPLEGYTNIDDSPTADSDIQADAMTYLAGLENDSVDEIYAGHFLEHLPQVEGLKFLAECWRVLKPGGKCGIVVPDMKSVLAQYVAGSPALAEHPANTFWPLKDLDAVCGLFLYGTCQESQHRWSYDGSTLGRAMLRSGFVDLVEIDRDTDERLGSPAWYQGGWDGWKPA